MRLIHFAAAPIVEIWPTEPFQMVAPKPKGLWLSDEDEFGWREWCVGEEFGLDRMTVAHEITLASDANILHIRDAEGIDDLTRRFRGADPYGLPNDAYRMNWPEIAVQWQGILITPYVGMRRLSMHCSWYYGWDCASGCIWDSEAIESFSVVELEPLAVES